MSTPAPAELIQIGQIEIRFRLPAGQTGGGLSLFEFRVPAQAKVPVPHRHLGFDETIYGLEGVLAWTLEGREQEVGPGDVLFIPRGEVHHFENTGTDDALQLSVITPGILGPEYFRDLAGVIGAGGPPDLGRIMAVMRSHGLEPVLPSPAAG